MAVMRGYIVSDWLCGLKFGMIPSPAGLSCHDSYPVITCLLTPLLIPRPDDTSGSSQGPTCSSLFCCSSKRSQLRKTSCGTRFEFDSSSISARPPSQTLHVCTAALVEELPGGLMKLTLWPRPGEPSLKGGETVQRARTSSDLKSLR